MQFDIRRLDIYRKIPKDLTQPTLAGAIISIICVFFMLYLFFAELYEFITPHVSSEMIVADPVNFTEKIPVQLNVSIHKMDCKYLGLDIQDDLGRHDVGFEDRDVRKEPIKGGEGCDFFAHFLVNKVPGNFHISTHSAKILPANPDFSHTIFQIAFGTSMVKTGLKYVAHGAFNPLSGVIKKDNPLASHDYFLKVVPSVYESYAGESHFPYQYTYAYRQYTAYGHSGNIVPAIWFRYDLSPITVYYKETRKPFYHFLTMICAIVGGTFTVAGIIDSLFFSAIELVRKAELGKLS